MRKNKTKKTTSTTGKPTTTKRTVLYCVPTSTEKTVETFATGTWHNAKSEAIKEAAAIGFKPKKVIRAIVTTFSV